MYDVYNLEYDFFNYYLVIFEDKKWFKMNKIIDDLSVIVLNNDGDVLVIVKFGLLDKKLVFEYYFDKKLKRVNIFYFFNKIIKNKKVIDVDLILVFNNVVVMELLYDYELDDVSNDENFLDFKLVKVVLDKKEVF